MISRHNTPSPTPSRGFIPSLLSNYTLSSHEPQEGNSKADKLEAKQRSEMIDQALKNEKIARATARRNQRKVLVLGQSESGKTTLIKQLRLISSPEAFAIERMSWRSIVFLNVVRSILTMIDIISPHFNLHNPQDSTSQKFARLRLRLTPLLSVEAAIVESLSSPHQVAQTRVKKFRHDKSLRVHRSSNLARAEADASEMDDEFGDVYVHPESSWHRVLHKCMRSSNAIRASMSDRNETPLEDLKNDDDVVDTLQACAADMKAFWECPTTHQYLKQSGLFMEEKSGFFLNDLERITSRGYMPTDDDILRSRVKTIAPTETMLPNLEPGLEWRMYDVGGARRQRAKWAPFFDDMDLIIVLVPVSAFDQFLAEDKTVNRIRDSFELWLELCDTTALHHIPVLLFLNKCDILDKKLEAGIKLADYLSGYTGKPNETKHALNYLSRRFVGIRKTSTAPSTTPCYIHHTSVVDTETTRQVIAYVRDKIVITHMRESYFV
ncbi:P-loop containing nucleoside triphosphate hydrolase protein [Ceratobasidium sp. AG-I]|nr:P-loop containing nucleoside triphosphate hydrolase protein [Ceratobasidium sp. AG-I]